MVAPTIANRPTVRPQGPRPVRPAAAPAFETLSATDKAVLGVQRAGKLAPGAVKGMWDHKGQVLAGFVAPYLHPIRSLKEANAAVAASAKEDLIETGLSVVKHHGGLLAAWALPVSIALVPFTGGASLVGAAASILGMATLGATGVSLGKNVVDAALAKNEDELNKQSEQILNDAMGLGTAAVTAATAHGVSKAVSFARGRYGPGTELPGPKAEPMDPAAMKAQRDQVLKAVSELSDDQVKQLELVPAKADQMLRGNNIKLVVKDAQGRKYLFKPLPKDSTVLEAEQFAMNLRRRAGEPTIAVVPKQVKMPDGTVLDGYVKPFVKNEGNLTANPAEWTLAQREQTLSDAPWMEFLGNYDTKVDQSVKIGDTALNVDWDLSTSDYLTNAPLSRFKAHNPAPPAQDLLYRQYVKGQLDLDFRPVFETIDRIQALPESAVRQELAPFVAKAFAGGKPYGPYQTPEAFIQAVLKRQKNLKTDFTQLVADLNKERDFNLGRSKELPSWGEYVGTAAQDKKMQAIGELVDTKAFGYGNQLLQKLNALKAKKAAS